MKVTWPLRAMARQDAGRPSARALRAVPAGPDDEEALEPDWAEAIGLPPAAAGEEQAREEEAAASALARLHYLANRPEPAAFPKVALRLLDVLLAEEVDVQELCRLVELDAALAGAVLARANTASGRALDPIQTVRHAVTRLGTSEVARVASAAALRTLYDRGAGAAFGQFTQLWPVLFRHAVVTGRLAADLAHGRAGADPELAYVAGLLHDAGLPLALRSLAALTQDGTLQLRDPASALRVALRVHDGLGAEAAKAWSLPPALSGAICDHHEPPAGQPVLVRLVALASALDLCGSAPEAARGAAREAVAAARSLGGTPPWLAGAVARRAEAVAWARRCFQGL